MATIIMRSISEYISDVWGVPKEAVMNIAKITLSQNKEIYIEEHKGIKEYGEGLIRVALPKNILKLSGSALEIASIGVGFIRITGNIEKIEFEL